jgi:hypothetical protein
MELEKTPPNQDSKKSFNDYGNTKRDEATLGFSKDIQPNPPGAADEDTPPWSPPETQPEPRPVDPVLSPSQTAPTNTNSPA